MAVLRTIHFDGTIDLRLDADEARVVKLLADAVHHSDGHVGRVAADLYYALRNVDLVALMPEIRDAHTGQLRFHEPRRADSARTVSRAVQYVSRDVQDTSSASGYPIYYMSDGSHYYMSDGSHNDALSYLTIGGLA